MYRLTPNQLIMAFEKAIKFERDCKAITKENYMIFFPQFAKKIYAVFGDEIGGHLVCKLESECNFNAISFIQDLDQTNLTKFLNNY